MKGHVVHVVVMLLLGFMLLPAVAMAAEARCAALDAQYGAGTCVCSEPLNTSTITMVEGSPDYRNPADSTTKECALDGRPGAYFSGAGSISLFPTSSGEAIDNMPPGHVTPITVWRGTDRGPGGYAEGTQFPSSSPTARIAARWYVYHSANFDFQNGGAGGCNPTNSNSGKMSFTNHGMIHTYNGSYVHYAWNGWSPSGLDLVQDPGWAQSGAAGVLNLAGHRGKWFRYERVIRNAGGGPGLRFEVYMKNVTNNGPEYKIGDSSVTCSAAQCGGIGWPASATTNLDPPGRISSIMVDSFRNNCPGWQAFSHYLAAAWNTDAGQRIGAASEIEAGGGVSSPPPSPPSSPPSAPTNLRLGGVPGSYQAAALAGLVITAFWLRRKLRA